jgi:hypothetical protein
MSTRAPSHAPTWDESFLNELLGVRHDTDPSDRQRRYLRDDARAQIARIRATRQAEAFRYR